MDPKELDALATQLDEEHAEESREPFIVDGLGAVEKALAHNRYLEALTDASEALRRASEELRKAYGL